MEIKEFWERRPYLYHLTDRDNLDLILKAGKLLSTKAIAEMAFGNNHDALTFLRGKRENHEVLTVGKTKYKIRDQNPISLKVLGKSLSGGMTAPEFIELLNKRVFWWPTINRLERHYVRYKNENPVIFRVSTKDMLELNTNVEFCHLNSGATRCHPSYGGNAPTRGKKTFLPADSYLKTIPSVAEVTFPEFCKMPSNLWLGSSPNGLWKKL